VKRFAKWFATVAKRIPALIPIIGNPLGDGPGNSFVGKVLNLYATAAT
jgi:hypothetical protein